MPDAIIIGAGIVGAAIARACAARGLKVLLLDRSPGPGEGATAAGMGHLVVMDDSEPQFSLTHYSQQLWQTLASKLPPQAEYRPTGTLWVAADSDEMAEVHRKHAFYQAHQVPTEILDAQSLAQAEPNLRPGLAGALAVPSDAVIYPPTVTPYLLNHPNITVQFSTHVIAIRQGRAVEANCTIHQAPVIINAAGAWAQDLSPHLPIRRRKGHLLITDRYPGWLNHQLVELGYLKSAHSSDDDSVAFNAQPRATGQILIGSSRQFNESAEVDHALLAKMLSRATLYMPALAQLQSLRVWTGFRAATPDSLPLIGPDPYDETIFQATGHEGLGITTSLATAELVADQITGTPTKIPAAPYHPCRSTLTATH